jgi:hypothetical protein
MASRKSIMDERLPPSKKNKEAAKRTSKKGMKGAANVLKKIVKTQGGIPPDAAKLLGGEAKFLVGSILKDLAPDSPLAKKWIKALKEKPDPEKEKARGGRAKKRTEQYKKREQRRRDTMIYLQRGGAASQEGPAANWPKYKK